MKIGFLIESLEVSAGGPAKVAGMVASELCKRGHDVLIGTLPWRSEWVTFDPDVRLMCLATGAAGPGEWLVASKGIRKLVRDLDVLFVSGIWGPVDGLALRLAGIRDVPVHIRTCGMLEDYILRRHPTRKYGGRTAYVDHNLSHAASLIANTSIEASNIRKLGFKTPINIIPNGVLVPEPSDRLGREEASDLLGVAIGPADRVMLYLSRIHPKKGLHVLLRTLPRVFSANPDWRLIVAGDFYTGEGYEHTIRELAAVSGLGNRIDFVGSVSGARKLAAFSLANLFVLPSSSEGFSNAVLEAMSWAIPVAITKACNFPEVAENAAGWVTTDDEASLEAALSQACAEDPASLARRGHSARSLVEAGYQQFMVVDLYEKIAAASAKARKPARVRRAVSSGSPRRIVFFAEGMAVASGGTAVEVAMIASALAAEERYEVTVVTCEDSRTPIVLAPQVRVRKVAGGLSLGRWPGAVQDLKRELDGADVAFVTGLWGPVDGLGMRFALPEGLPCYWRICGMLQPYILRRHPWKKIPARWLYVEHNLNRADGLIVNSASERQQVLTLGFRSPVHLIRNGVLPPESVVDKSVARSRLGLAAADRVFLYLGRIHPKKGLHKLLAAMAEFESRGHRPVRAKLLVAGGCSDDAFGAQVHDLASGLSDRTAVQFLGEVSGEEREQAFAAADAFILPSESEGLPNAALESMVRGLPVVLTPGCNLPEVETFGAGLLLAPDEAGLRQALEWVSGPADILEQAGRNAKGLVDSEFGIARVVDQYKELIP